MRPDLSGLPCVSAVVCPACPAVGHTCGDVRVHLQKFPRYARHSRVMRYCASRKHRQDRSAVVHPIRYDQISDSSQGRDENNSLAPKSTI
ncbi:hypothetical protein EVAR_25245_1 [Eumeta japonica]|uniref:Uncharacterized protein n=1 Tax=Eumeta variegata TaxID=151549 RepID=A0A4C1WGN9_EUMVA|nr:hypothetical protein EVAR_25245_1 [Eumeta japonica]